MGTTSGLAVDGTRRRKDHRGDLVSRHRVKQFDAAAHVVFVILPGIANRLSYVSPAGEMKHYVDLFALEDAVESLPRLSGLGKIGRQQFDSLDGFPVSLAQTVQDDDTLASTNELPYSMRADVTGSTGNQDGGHERVGSGSSANAEVGES